MSRDRFEAIARLVPNPVLVCDADGRVLAASASAARAVPGLVRGSELVALALDGAPAVRSQLDNWLRSGDLVPGGLTFKGPDGETVRFRCHGARATWWDGTGPVVQLNLTRRDHSDQFVALSQRVESLGREMAYRRAAQDERERLLRVERAHRRHVQHLHRLMSALAASVTLADVVRAVQRVAAPAAQADSVRLALRLDRLIPELEPTEELRALRGDAWSPVSPPDGHGTARPEQGTQVALEAEGEDLGVLTAVTGTPDRPTAPGIEDLRYVAQQIAQALRSAGRYEHEHRLAERLQRSLLPRLPDVPHLTLAGRYEPGGNLVMVGGDWYDVHTLDGCRTGLTVGDVAGHGLREATVMAQTSAALRAVALDHGVRPGAVLRELNEFLGAYHPGVMATACYLVHDQASGAVRYARAGHPPPLLLRAGGDAYFLEAGKAPPLGPVPPVEYPEGEVRVRPGDTLVLYTDGLIERRREDLAVGMERLRARAGEAAGRPVGELCDVLLDDQSGDDLPDDRAFLVVRFR